MKLQAFDSRDWTLNILEMGTNVACVLGPSVNSLPN
jgi:hypothetical protein